MKSSLLFFLMAAIASSVFCQQTNSGPTLTKQDYMQKSKKQKTKAWLLLGSGTVALAGGIIADRIAYYFDDDTPTGAILAMVAGGTAILVSIPFFGASSDNKNKAMNLSLKNEFIPQIRSKHLTYCTVPSLILKIRI